MDGRRTSSSCGWVRTTGTTRPVEEREPKWSESEETMSFIHDVITEEEVEE